MKTLHDQFQFFPFINLLFILQTFYFLLILRIFLFISFNVFKSRDAIRYHEILSSRFIFTARMCAVVDVGLRTLFESHLPNFYNITERDL